MVHARNLRTSCHDWENPARARRNSSPWNLICVGDWLEFIESRSWWYTWYTPQKKKKEKTRRGQYKKHILSRYHRPNQNRNWYMMNNSIKSTMKLRRLQATNNLIQWQHTKVSTQSITISSTHMRHMLPHHTIWEISSLRLSTLS